jgi:flagellar hook-basal body complex protein FliE
MQIQPTNGVSNVQQPQASQPGGAGEKTKGNFGNALKQAIDHVDADQRASASAVRDFVTGKNENVLPVVQAVAEADLSFKLLMGVRNKVVEAYKQTMNMPI